MQLSSLARFPPLAVPQIDQTVRPLCRYEIHTQGDAFEIAFVSVVDAVNFANEVQLRLHLVKWDKDVLALPGWGRSYTPDGKCMMQGPRIRIGIHLAATGEWSRKLHTITKGYVFHGLAYSIANTISDAANGGQTLVTRAVCDALIPKMRACGFPIIENIGSFKILNQVLELFQIQPMQTPDFTARRFPEAPRKVAKISEGIALWTDQLSPWRRVSLRVVCCRGGAGHREGTAARVQA